MMDREQFTSAVLAAEPTLYRVAKTMLRSEHDCADAAQQAILRAWEQLDSLRSTRYFKTWLVRILINECSTILRRQQRLAPYDAAAAEAIPAPAADDYSDLYAAITALEEKLRLPARGAPDAGGRPAVRVSSSTTAGTMPRRTRPVTNHFSTPASFPRRVMVRLRVSPTDAMPQL